jgi:hypothetical protein
LLRCYVVDQAEGVADVGSGKLRLIFDDFTSGFNKAALRFIDVSNGDFKYRAQRWAGLDEQVDVLAVQADHPRVLVGDGEASQALDEGQASASWGNWAILQL